MVNTSLTLLDLRSDDSTHTHSKKRKRKEKKKIIIDNNIGDEGTMKLCESLKVNSSLTKLSLSCEE